jgi:hypothetical protein
LSNPKAAVWLLQFDRARAFLDSLSKTRENLRIGRENSTGKIASVGLSRSDFRLEANF